MFATLKKVTLLVAMAATLGTSVSATTTAANAMPRGPVVKSEATIQVRHRGHRGFRRFHRGHRWHGRRWHGRRWHRGYRWHPGYARHWGWRRCHRFLRRYRYTGSRYWLYRYRRCVAYRYW